MANEPSMVVTWLDVVTLVIALVSLVVGGGGLVLGTMAERRHRREERPRVSLRVTYSSVINRPEEAENPWVTMTVTNVGKLPVGLQSMGFGLGQGKWAQLWEYPPTEHRRLSAVLQTGESISVWTTKRGLVKELREGQLQLEEMIVNFTDGTEHREPVPAEWRNLRDEADA